MILGGFTPRDAATMVAKLAEGMAAAHQKGVDYRDLKPANVLLTEAARKLQFQQYIMELAFQQHTSTH